MKRRRHVKWIVVPILFTVAALIVYMNVSISPVIRDLARAGVENRASSIINEAIEKQLEEGNINYDKIIFLEKDISGNITALKTNIAEINRIKTQTLSTVDRLLLDLDVNEIGVPMGNLFLPELFSGTGPTLPVRVLSISNSEADFKNVFWEAGINQTAHQIMLDVSVIMTVLTPVGTLGVRAESTVMVAETVIVGHVPNSYVNLD